MVPTTPTITSAMLGNVLRGKQTREVALRLAGMAIFLPVGCILIYYDDRPTRLPARLLCRVSGVLLVSVAFGLGFFPIYHQCCKEHSQPDVFHGGNYTLPILPDQNTGLTPSS